MRTHKKIFALSLIALSLGFTGCLTDDDEDKALTVAALTSVSVNYGDSINFDAEASGGTAPYSYKWFGLLDSDTAEFEDSASVLAGIASAEETPDGIQVWVEVTDSKGAKAVSNKATLTITFDTGDTLTLGAQGNLNVGSVLDLDSGKVWSSQVANLNQAKIDLVYLYYGAVGDSAASLNGALAAKDSGSKYNINLTNTYTTAKNIQFVKVTEKPASVSLATAAYAAGAKLRSARVVAGDKFVVLSSEGRYYFVEVKTVAGARTGSASLSFVAGEIAED